MIIKNPIFIVGSGRSGTTIFDRFLSMHPEVSWFSNYSNRFVNIKQTPILHRIVDLPYIGPWSKKRFASKNKLYLKPSEAQLIYHGYCGFEFKKQSTENDLNKATEEKFKDVIKNHLVLTGKKRFVSKQTANTQRIRLIGKMFSDAYFIHMIRDGRAVANSLLNVRFWNDTDIWWLGEKASDWEKKGGAAIELCGLHWKRDVEEIQKNKNLFEDRYIEVRYEDFVSNVRSTMDRVASFCELSKSESYSRLLPQTLSNMNYKWQEQLTVEQKKILERTIKPFLNQLGYV